MQISFSESAQPAILFLNGFTSMDLSPYMFYMYDKQVSLQVLSTTSL